jgi:hypothetical protein
LRSSVRPIWIRRRAGLSLSRNDRPSWAREVVCLLLCLLGLAVGGRVAALAEKQREGGAARAADLTVCSVGPPTVSDTGNPHRRAQCRQRLCLHFGRINKNWPYQQIRKSLCNPALLTTHPSAGDASSCLFRDKAVSAAGFPPWRCRQLVASWASRGLVCFCTTFAAALEPTELAFLIASSRFDVFLRH